uniref:Tyr recombinase domain-containing protein n=1 Tax=Xenopus tropicalis TaxID=8364 RepID=A0A6I8RCF9_XENTR
MSRLPQDPHKQDAFLSIVQDLLEERVIVPVPPYDKFRGFYSNLFIVPKKDGSFRPVLDLKHLNVFIRSSRFKMESLRSVIATMNPNEFLVALDIKDAYLHVPIFPPHWKFLRFAIRNNHFQFTALPFRTHLSPQDIYQNHVGSRSLAEIQRSLHHSLPGRPTAQSTLSPSSHIPALSGHGHPDHAGMENQHSKISANASSTHALPRHALRHGTAKGLPPTRKYRQNPEPSSATHSHPSALHSIRHVSAGIPGILHRSGPLCPVPSKDSTVEHFGSMESQLSLPTNQASTQNKSSPVLVAQSDSPGERPFPTGTTVAHTNHGRQPPRLGRSPGTSLSSGNLGSSRDPTSNQYIRNQSGTPSSMPLAEPTHRMRHQDPIGQRNHGCIPEPPGGHKKSTSTQGSQSHSNMGRSKGSTANRDLHPRTRELAGRLSQPSKDRSRGMGLESQDLPRHCGPMGPSGGRPHGLPSQPESDAIHVQMSRPPSASSGCLDDHVGLRPGLRLPTSPSASQSSPKDQIRKMHSHTDSSTLAQKSLVHRAGGAQQSRSVASTSHSRPPHSRANPPPRSSLPEFDGVAIELLVLTRKGFSQDVIRTLMAARKPVSSKTYHRVWKTYNDWCNQTGNSFQDLSVPRLLSFLQSGLDKGLSLSSLKSQISALSVLFQERLAILPDVTTFIQGVSRICPPFREPLPPWDLNLVLSALQVPPFEPLATIPLAWLTWKTVFLLAIASARRVSEISALSCQHPFLIFHADRAVLRTIPSFVPKVVSTFHINQDITIPSFCPHPASPKEVALHSLDPVRALKFYLHRTQDIRATTSLFVLHSGTRKGHQASKTTISRWIREAIRRAYVARGRSPPVHITAHSTRGIGTSWAFRNRASAEQVCRAATWSSIHSFTKFYQFEVFAASDAHFGRKVLQAAVN